MMGAPIPNLQPHEVDTNMTKPIKAVLVVLLMMLSLAAIPTASAGTYSIANVISWSAIGGDSAPAYAWGPAPESEGGLGQVTGQIRDTDNQAWMFPSNITIVNASNSTVDPSLWRRPAGYGPLPRRTRSLCRTRSSPRPRPRCHSACSTLQSSQHPLQRRELISGRTFSVSWGLFWTNRPRARGGRMPCTT